MLRTVGCGHDSGTGHERHDGHVYLLVHHVCDRRGWGCELQFAAQEPPQFRGDLLGHYAILAQKFKRFEKVLIGCFVERADF